MRRQLPQQARSQSRPSLGKDGDGFVVRGWGCERIFCPILLRCHSYLRDVHCNSYSPRSTLKATPVSPARDFVVRLIAAFLTQSPSTAPREMFVTMPLPRSPSTNLTSISANFSALPRNVVSKRLMLVTLHHHTSDALKFTEERHSE